MRRCKSGYERIFFRKEAGRFESGGAPVRGFAGFCAVVAVLVDIQARLKTVFQNHSLPF